MKPAAFTYSAPTTVDEVLAELAEHGDDAKILAGGQSLVPIMNFRLARPAHLIDINGVSELAYVTRRDGRLRIGAIARQSTVERSALVRSGWPLLPEALAHVAHPQIRNRGTVCGSLAHGDGAAEMPAILAACEGHVVARSVRGTRELRPDELFVGSMVTTLEPDELLVEAVYPPRAAATGQAFEEYARRHGDFPFAGAAASVTVDPEGVCTRAVIVLQGVASTPVRASAAEAELRDRPRSSALIERSAAIATAELEPPSDVHGSGEFRARVCGELVQRTVQRAWERAIEEQRDATD